MNHLFPGNFQGKMLCHHSKGLLCLLVSHCSPERWVLRPGETYAEDTSKGEQDAATTQDACRDRWHSLEREACQCADSSPLPSPNLKDSLGRGGFSVLGTYAL